MKVQCRECHKTFDVPATVDQIVAWKGGGLIQRVMPHLTASDRELLMTATCGDCCDKMFSAAE